MLTINFHFSPNRSQKGTDQEQPDKWDDVVHLIAFIPKAMINGMDLAGLLARLILRCLPIRQMSDSGEGFGKCL
jgi:hypothetical protein